MFRTTKATWAIQKILADMVFDFSIPEETAKEICHEFTKEFAVGLGNRRADFNDWDQAIYAICVEQLESLSSAPAHLKKFKFGFIGAVAFARFNRGLGDQQGIAHQKLFELGERFNFSFEDAVTNQTTVEENADHGAVVAESTAFINEVISGLFSFDKYMNDGVTPNSIAFNNWTLGFLWGLTGQIVAHDLKFGTNDLSQHREWGLVCQAISSSLNVSQEDLEKALNAALRNKGKDFLDGQQDGINHHKKFTFATKTNGDLDTLTQEFRVKIRMRFPSL